VKAKRGGQSNGMRESKGRESRKDTEREIHIGTYIYIYIYIYTSSSDSASMAHRSAYFLAVAVSCLGGLQAFTRCSARLGSARPATSLIGLMACGRSAGSVSGERR